MKSKTKLYILVLFLSLAGYSWVFRNVYQYRSHEKPVSSCLFRTVTGIPCPSCGTTHSVISIMKGDFREAVKENPLGFLVALMLIVFPIWILVDLFTRKKSFFDFYSTMEDLLKRKWIAYPAVILLIINWILNIHRNI